MIIKTTFKSHFKIKNFFKKNKNKYIFVKNIVVFFLFSKIFLKNITTSIRYFTKNKLYTNILKAPSRHKKFFHQIFLENFFIKIYFFYKNFLKIPLYEVINFFSKMNFFFLKIGTNILTRVKFLVVIPVKLNFDFI